MNTTASNNFESIVKAIGDMKQKDIATKMSDILSAIEKMEDRKRKVEDEMNSTIDRDVILKKEAIITKLEEKIEDLYEAM